MISGRRIGFPRGRDEHQGSDFGRFSVHLLVSGGWCGLYGVVGRCNVSRSYVKNVAWHGSNVAGMSVTFDGEICGPNHQIGKISFDRIDRFDL